MELSSSHNYELLDAIQNENPQLFGFLPVFSKFGQLFTVYYLLSKDSASAGMSLTLIHSSVVIALKLFGIGLNFDSIDRQKKVRFFDALQKEKKLKRDLLNIM